MDESTELANADGLLAGQAPIPESAFDRTWEAEWIWVGGDDGAEPATIFQLDMPPRPPDTIAMFRRAFELTSVPSSAPCRVTADGRYQLFVNGTRIGRGPVRSEPSNLAWDEYDLASHLVVGSNTIAILARNFGEATLYWKPAKPVGQLGLGSLLVEARVGPLSIISDSEWRSRLAPYVRAQPGRWDGDPAVEIVDGRSIPHGWTGPDFDDGDWSPAMTLAPAGLGIHRSTPPSDPFGQLDRADIGQLAERVVTPRSIVGSGASAPAASERPIDDLLHDTPGTLQAEPADATGFGLSGGRWLTVDFGAITNSHPILTLHADRGTVIDLAVGEDLTPDGRPVIEPRRWTMRYTAAGIPGEVIEALEPVGFRYLQISVRSGAVASVEPSALYRYYPRPDGPSFQCDDERLNTVWNVGVQTLDACAVDAFLDCPGREQRAWMGDAYVESLVSFVSNADTGLVTHNTELLRQGVRADGLRPMVGGGDFSESVVTIPDFSLHWIRNVVRVFEHLGDIHEAERMWPRMLDALQWFEWHRGADDLLVDLTGWIWIDWAQTERGRNIAAADALYVLALDDAALLADALGDGGTAGRLRSRADRSRAAMALYWDQSRGVFVDARSPEDGCGRRVSQQTNALAILCGAAPESTWDTILDHVVDDSRLVLTQHPGDGGPAPDRLLYQWMPARTFGGDRLLDEEREVVMAQPFFCHFLHQALVQAGRMDDLLASIRRWDGLIDRGDQALGEYWDQKPGHGSRCHAWSATPTFDLTTHVLGVRRTTVGWSEVAVEPWFGPLEELAGVVPTPLGEIRVELHRDRGGQVQIPDGVSGIFRFEAIERRLGPGTHDINW